MVRVKWEPESFKARDLPRKALRAGVALGLAAGLSGCATSGAMTLMSLGASGVSFAVSGKSLSDHALSVVLDRDCAFWRPVKGEPICRDGSAHDEQLASIEPVVMETGWPRSRPTAQTDGIGVGGQTSVEALRIISRPSSTAYEISGSAPVSALRVASGNPETEERVRAPAPEFSVSHDEPRRFWVLGSFADRGNATALAARISGVSVMTVELSVGIRHRVVFGPGNFARPGLPNELTSQGVKDAWPLTLCVPHLKAPPCLPGSHLIAAAD